MNSAMINRFNIHADFLKGLAHSEQVYAASLSLSNKWHVIHLAACHLSSDPFMSALEKIPRVENGIHNWAPSEWVKKGEPRSIGVLCDPSGFPCGIIAIEHSAQGWSISTVAVETFAEPYIKMAHDGCRAWLAERVLAEPQDFIGNEGQTKSETQQWPHMILTAGPTISEREAVFSLDAARRGWNNEWAKYLKQLESEFAAYIGVKYALATSCCTGGLHLSLLSLGIGPGDEVIVPDSTWVATANAVTYTGATPVFADVQLDSWCLDPNSFESKITPRTKAVVPVHMYGHPAEMNRIMAIAKKYALAVVEDAAPSIGAEFKGQRTGSFGDLACFSFQGAKLMVTGEGGMIVTNNDELYRKVYKIWDQGRQPGGFWIDAVGWKYKMSNIQAALGVGQLAHVNTMIEAKRRIAGWYNEGLAGVPGITFWKETEWARSIYWMSSILVGEECRINRDTLREELKKRNVDTRSVFPAISQYPIWTDQQQAQPVAKRIGERGMNLPSGVKLTRDEVNYVCRVIKDCVA